MHLICRFLPQVVVFYEIKEKPMTFFAYKSGQCAKPATISLEMKFMSTKDQFPSQHSLQCKLCASIQTHICVTYWTFNSMTEKIYPSELHKYFNVIFSFRICDLHKRFFFQCFMCKHYMFEIVIHSTYF